MSTRAGSDEYKGNKLFAVYNEDANGDIEVKPIISFGLKKAQAILNHLDDFEKWCEENGLEKQD
jgi:hypothetical protein